MFKAVYVVGTGQDASGALANLAFGQAMGYGLGKAGRYMDVKFGRGNTDVDMPNCSGRKPVAPDTDLAGSGPKTPKVDTDKLGVGSKSRPDIKGQKALDMDTWSKQVADVDVPKAKGKVGADAATDIASAKTTDVDLTTKGKVTAEAAGAVAGAKVADVDVPKAKVPEDGRQLVADDLLNTDGVFKNAELEIRYQKYVQNKQKHGVELDEIRDRLDWKAASDYYTKNSPIARGNRFNETVKQNKLYPHNEVNLENGKRLDSYDPVAGEIISRKATDLDKIQEKTFKGYLQEFQDKYSRGTVIRSNKYESLDGAKLEGKYILEVPESNKNLPDIEKYQNIAKEYDVELRFTEE